MKENAGERDNPRNIAQTSGYGKDHVTHTNLTNLGLRKRPHRLYFFGGRSFLSASSRSSGSLACSALGGRLSRALGCGGRNGRGGLHGSRGRTLGGGGGRLASCYLVADAAEAIIGDVQPRALFQEEGIAHGTTKNISENASAVSRDCRSKALATAPHLNPTHVVNLSHSSTPKHKKSRHAHSKRANAHGG